MKVFVEDIFAGMELTESDWSRDFEVEDPDVSQDRTYEVVEGSLNVSHPSLEGIEEPFSAKPNGKEALIVLPILSSSPFKRFVLQKSIIS